VGFLRKQEQGRDGSTEHALILLVRSFHSEGLSLAEPGSMIRKVSEQVCLIIDHFLAQRSRSGLDAAPIFRHVVDLVNRRTSQPQIQDTFYDALLPPAAPSLFGFERQHPTNKLDARTGSSNSEDTKYDTALSREALLSFANLDFPITSAESGDIDWTQLLSTFTEGAEEQPMAFQSYTNQ